MGTEQMKGKGSSSSLEVTAECIAHSFAYTFRIIFLYNNYTDELVCQHYL